MTTVIWHLSLKTVLGAIENSRVALDRVGVAVDAGAARLYPAALEEGIAVGVGLFSGTDVSVERVGGRADGQLLRSHWLGCQEDKVMQREGTTMMNMGYCRP